MAAKELKFDTNGTARKPFLIGVAGGTASGKSSVCKRIVELLGQNDTQNDANRRVAIVSQDSYYRELSAEEQQAAEMGNFNFDHPRAFDEKKMAEALKKILHGQRVQVPVYDYVKNRITPDKYLSIDSVDVVLVEGILTFYFSEIRELFDLKLFVDTDADTRLSRRVIRDTKEYGRDLDQSLYQYVNYVKPAFEEFCLPTKKYADVIIPRGIDNRVAIDLIVQHIRELQKTTEKTRSPPVRVNSTPSDLLNYDDDDYSGRRPGVRPH